MIRHTNPRTISQIFPNDEDIIYKIPKYQRKYTWGQKEWDMLFNDIIENEEGYFLGSTILVALPGSAYGPRELEVIDGQQRLTSLSLLLSVIYSKLNEHRNELDEDNTTDLNNLRREITVKDKTTGKYSPKLELQIQDHNREDYNGMLHEKGIIDSGKAALFAGNRKIFKAYRYFEKLVSNFLIEADGFEGLKGETEIQTLINLKDRFNKSVLVVIEVDTHKDAYMLFESLNNRGVPLTAIDLIKNLLIATADKDGKSDEVYNRRMEIVDNLGDEYSGQERFFRQYYNAYRTELNEGFTGDKKYPLGYLATKTTLMEIYEKLIKKDYNEFLDKISESAKSYAIITNKETQKPVPYQNKLKNLEYVQGAPSYLLLLFLEEHKNSLDLSDSEMSKIIEFLSKFFIRRNVTDIPNTRNLTKIFMDTIELVKGRGDKVIFDVIKDKLVSESASDEEFEKKLRGPMYDNNYDATRFVLCYIEEQHQTKEIYRDLWEKSSNKYIWTIEHVFPEGQNIPRAWIDMIAGGDKKLAEKYLEEYVHTLGNLTISGYNQNLSNMSFEEKKDRKTNGKYIGYKNGLYLNEDIVNEECWTIDKIKARTDKLVNIALKLFSFND